MTDHQSINRLVQKYQTVLEHRFGTPSKQIRKVLTKQLALHLDSATIIFEHPISVDGARDISTRDILVSKLRYAIESALYR